MADTEAEEAGLALYPVAHATAAVVIAAAEVPFAAVVPFVAAVPSAAKAAAPLAAVADPHQRFPELVDLFLGVGAHQNQGPLWAPNLPGRKAKVGPYLSLGLGRHPGAWVGGGAWFRMEMDLQTRARGETEAVAFVCSWLRDRQTRWCLCQTEFQVNFMVQW